MSITQVESDRWSMESSSTSLGKDTREAEYAVICATECLEPNQETRRCRKSAVPERTLILSITRSRASATCREFFLHSIHSSRNSIPKHIITFDEKYAISCLQLIRNFAARVAARNFTSKVGVLPDHTSNLAYIEDTSSSNMAIEYPLGSVSRSQTMINILNSPLLQQFGTLDHANFVKTNFLGVSEPFYSNHTMSLVKEGKDHRYASAPLHRREASVSSTSSSYSDQSSSSGYGASFQGMLHCTWEDGLPHHVFTVDDKREVYAADLSRVGSHEKDLDCFYTFYSRRNDKKDRGFHELESQSIAKMRVSTSIRFSSNDTEVRETRFVLSMNSDNNAKEMHIPNHVNKKNRRLTKKVVEFCRQSHLYKQRSSTTLGSSAISEENPQELSEDVRDNFAEFADAPDLELAAVVVKDTYIHRKEAEVGGWGLKFLKKPPDKESLDSVEDSRNREECSKSTDVLIPAGIHGRPRTSAGPSSIIERWKNGGNCDCGGWDLGCPLTILNTSSENKDHSSGMGKVEECKTFDLFLQGSKQDAPTMRMVNIHKGLYYIHFQSTLSTLQSFAIAAALIHSRSPLLRSDVYRA